MGRQTRFGSILVALALLCSLSASLGLTAFADGFYPRRCSLACATVTVDPEERSVEVSVPDPDSFNGGSFVVSERDYTITFFRKAEAADGTEYVPVGPEFPDEPGVYYVRAASCDDSAVFRDGKNSADFVLDRETIERWSADGPEEEALPAAMSETVR